MGQFKINCAFFTAKSNYTTLDVEYSTALACNMFGCTLSYDSQSGFLVKMNCLNHDTFTEYGMAIRSIIVFLFFAQTCVAQDLNLDAELTKLKVSMTKNMANYERISCSYTAIENFVLGKNEVVSENYYARIGEAELWLSGSRSIDPESVAKVDEGILCASDSFSFHILRRQGQTDYILHESGINKKAELKQKKSRIRNDNSLLYQPFQLGFLPLSIVLNQPHIIINRASYTKSKSGVDGIKFEFKFDMSKAVKLEHQNSKQQTEGWFIVTPSLGMVVDSYELIHRGPINRSYKGFASYKMNGSEPVLISAQRDTYEGDKLVHSIKIDDVDIKFSVDTNEVFLLSYYQMPDFVGVTLPEVSFYAKYRTLIVSLSLAMVCILIAVLLAYVIRKRAKSNSPPPAGRS